MVSSIKLGTITDLFYFVKEDDMQSGKRAEDEKMWEMMNSERGGMVATALRIVHFIEQTCICR
jgi:hypothetical protein